MTTPKPPRWTRHVQSVSIGGFLLLPVGSLGTRFGLWPYTIGVGMFGLGLLLVLATGLTGLIGTPILRRRGAESGALQTAVFFAVVAGFFLFPHIRAALTTPAIHQVTTNITDPPTFDAILRVRPPDSNPVSLTPDVIDAQRQAYPWLQTFVVRITADDAYETALLVAEAMAFETVLANEFTRTIEATATSFWFGFKDDLVIRIEPRADGSRVDIRSVSRVGSGDLGANADRIGEFFRRYEIEVAQVR